MYGVCFSTVATTATTTTTSMLLRQQEKEQIFEGYTAFTIFSFSK